MCVFPLPSFPFPPLCTPHHFLFDTDKTTCLSRQKKIIEKEMILRLIHQSKKISKYRNILSSLIFHILFAILKGLIKKNTKKKRMRCDIDVNCLHTCVVWVFVCLCIQAGEWGRVANKCKMWSRATYCCVVLDVLRLNSSNLLFRRVSSTFTISQMSNHLIEKRIKIAN